MICELSSRTEQYDTVLIRGAGPSLNANTTEIQAVYRDTKPLVIGTGYNFNVVPLDYNCFVGKSVFRDRIKHTRCRKIITTEWVRKHNKDLLDHDTKHDFFMLRTTRRDDTNNYWTREIVIKDGAFQHELSNCGFTALLSSYFFRPKRVIIVGFDGPESDGITMRHFNMKVRKQKGSSKSKEVSAHKANFLGRIIKFLNNENIEIARFDEDRLWGLDTTGLRVDSI